MNQHQAWIDIETTGLEPFEHILEIGCIITNNHLEEIDRWSSVVGHTSNMIRFLSPLVKEIHEKSGLLVECINDKAPPLRSVELEFRDFLDKYNLEGTPIGGSSVSFDIGFIRRYMPIILERFHYRIIDTSSYREFIKRFVPDINLPNNKRGIHRVLPDLEDTLADARFFARLLGEGF